MPFPSSSDTMPRVWAFSSFQAYKYTHPPFLCLFSYTLTQSTPSSLSFLDPATAASRWRFHQPSFTLIITKSPIHQKVSLVTLDLINTSPCMHFLVLCSPHMSSCAHTYKHCIYVFVSFMLPIEIYIHRQLHASIHTHIFEACTFDSSFLTERIACICFVRAWWYDSKLNIARSSCHDWDCTYTQLYACVML